MATPNHDTLEGLFDQMSLELRTQEAEIRARIETEAGLRAELAKRTDLLHLALGHLARLTEEIRPTETITISGELSEDDVYGGFVEPVGIGPADLQLPPSPQRLDGDFSKEVGQ